jgi:hypothetical protein
VLALQYNLIKKRGAHVYMREIERRRTSGIHDITRTKKKDISHHDNKEHNDEIGDIDIERKKRKDRTTKRK